MGGLCCFPLDVPDGERLALSAVLAPDEEQRARRFHATVHGNRFRVARARLRQQLAALLAAAPADITFETGPHGKPQLGGVHALTGLEFNLSHSDTLGLVGWAWRRAIGVDIEFWRDMHDEAALVRRFFSPAEIAAYESFPGTARRCAFFNGWTRKEAYVKAVGRGLGLPLDSFDVSLGAADTARLERHSAVQDDARTWSLAALPLDAGVSAAVVLEGDPFLIIPG